VKLPAVTVNQVNETVVIMNIHTCPLSFV